MLPFILLYVRRGKKITAPEIVLWSLLVVISFGITLTQIVHVCIAILFRVLWLTNTKDWKAYRLPVVKLSLSLIIGFSAIVALAHWQYDLYNKTPVFYKTNGLDEEGGYTSFSNWSIRPMRMVSSLVSQIFITDFMAIYPVESDFSKRFWNVEYYTISFEMTDVDYWRPHHIALLFLLGVMFYLPVLRLKRFPKHLYPLLMSFASQLILHSVYGREYILYALNWQGILVCMLVYISLTSQLEIIQNYSGVRLKRKLFSMLMLLWGILIVFLGWNNFNSLNYLYRVLSDSIMIVPASNRTVTEKSFPAGNLAGSMHDNNTETLFSTFDDTRQTTASFEVQYNTPVIAESIVFSHGKNYPNGGWFDSEKAPVKLEIQMHRKGSYIPFINNVYRGVNTNSVSPTFDGQTFKYSFQRPTRIYGIRIQGVPASGNDPNQSFATCSELRAISYEGVD